MNTLYGWHKLHIMLIEALDLEGLHIHLVLNIDSKNLKY